MTCVIAWKTKDKVWMGADSLGSNNYNQMRVRLDEKVFKKNNMIFGFTASFRMGQLLRYKLKIPKQNKTDSDMKYMCTKFIDSVIKCLAENNYAIISENNVSGGTFLVGYKHNIYLVESDFQVGRSSRSYEAVGSGDDLAMGAMHGMCSAISEGDMPLKAFPMKTRIKSALDAASAFNVSVGGPYIILSI